jgi:hypothetical protein
MGQGKRGIAIFGNHGFLPLFHRPVEERAGERRLSSRSEVYRRDVDFSIPLSPLSRREGKEFRLRGRFKNSDALGQG